MPVLNQFSNEEYTYIKYDSTIKKTSKAALYDIDGMEIWFPLSQIEDDNEGIISVPTWLAKKKELL